KSWEEAFDEAEEERKRGRKCKGRQTEDAGRERQGKAANGHGGADQQRAKGDGDRAQGERVKDRGVDQDRLPPLLPFVDMSHWDDEPVPEQEWTVHDRIPNQQCMLFSGQGGAGKSTVQLQQSVAHVLARDWLGTMPRPGPALFVDAEDSCDVLHRRLAAIARHYGVTFAELIKGGLHTISLFGQDAVLATVGRSGKVEPTPLYQRLYQAAGDIKPVPIGMGGSGNVYAGSEIDRSQVQQFVSLLTRLAIVANGSVSLISHPSVSGIVSDSGISGNTQWHNSVRARSYMK